MWQRDKITIWKRAFLGIKLNLYVIVVQLLIHSRLSVSMKLVLTHPVND